MPMATPRSYPSWRHRSCKSPARSRIAGANCRARSAGLGTGTGSLKKIIMPSPAKRSSVPGWDRISSPIAAWYSRRTSITCSRFCPLGECGEASQIQEEDRELSAMASERVLRISTDDQFRELRREEPLKPSQPLQIRHLLLDLLGQCAVLALGPPERKLWSPAAH